MLVFFSIISFSFECSYVLLKNLLFPFLSPFTYDYLLDFHSHLLLRYIG